MSASFGRTDSRLPGGKLLSLRLLSGDHAGGEESSVSSKESRARSLARSGGLLTLHFLTLSEIIWNWPISAKLFAASLTKLKVTARRSKSPTLSCRERCY